MMVRFHPPVLGWFQRLTTVHFLIGGVVIPAIQQGFGSETKQKNHKSYFRSAVWTATHKEGIILAYRMPVSLVGSIPT